MAAKKTIAGLAAICMLIGGVASAASEPPSLHGRPWAFGQSQSRNDAIWKKGVEGSEVARKKKPVVKNGGEAANTAGGINRALTEAEKANVKGSVGVSLADQSSAWKVAPEEKRMQPDESMFRDRRHVVSAFADVKAGEDLSIKLGPELILKDERHGDETASESQPDSALGLGMKFQYDF